MTYENLLSKYNQYLSSAIKSDSFKAEALLSVIKEFKVNKIDEIYDDVKISIISEKLYIRYCDFWKSLKIIKYKYMANAVHDCIIKYATQDVIIQVLKPYYGVHNFGKYVSFINNTNLKGRVKKSDLKSVFEIESL